MRNYFFILISVLFFMPAADNLLLAQQGIISEKSLSPNIDYMVQFWNSENGLPQNSIISCFQTSDGFLWMSTTNGLVRFDGNKFKVFNTSNTSALPDNLFLKLFEDSEGHLWMITSTHKVLKYKNGVFEKIELTNSPNAFVTSIIENDNKELLLGCRNGDILNYNLKTGTSAFFRNVGPLYIFDLIYTNQKLCIATDKGLLIWENKKLISVKELESKKVLKLKKGLDDVVWAYSYDGLFKLLENTAQKINIPFDINYKSVCDLLIEKNNLIWLSTTSGLYIINEKSYKHLDMNSGLRSNFTTTLFKDKENNIWVGTDNAGINKLKLKTIQTFSQEDGLKQESCGPIISYKNGSVLISNFCKDVVLWDKKTFSLFNTQHIGCIWAMFYDTDESLYMGTYGSDLYTYNQGQPKLYFSLDKSLPNAYFSLFRDDQNTLWIGTLRGLFYSKNGSIQAFEKEKITGKISYIMQDSKGKIWFCSDNGVGCIENEETKIYTVDDGLSHNIVRHIYEDKEGTYWITTYGGGINRFKNGVFFAYNKNDEIIENSTSCMVEDENNTFWISSNRGIYSVKRSNLNDYADRKTPFLNTHYYGKEDGMKNSECNGGFQGAELKIEGGRILFPTVGGLAVVHSKNVIPTDYIPHVFIENVVVNDILSVNPDSLIEFSQVPGKMEFHFTAPYFGDAHNLLFQYQLEGYDEEWSKPQSKRSAAYLNLPPGNYVFKVLIYGSLTETKIAFKIPFPFWKTPLFYVLVSTFAISCILIVVYNRTKRIRKREANRIKINKQYAALELRTLQGQMNPHFLFNSLNSIKFFIATDDKASAGKYLGKFSKLIRLFLEHSTSNSITLENEINLLSLYVEMEQLRLDNGFDFNLHVDKDLDIHRVEMPAMLLQPFLENAILHGLKNIDRKGTLSVSFLLENTGLKILIDDNGIGREKAAELKKMSSKSHKSMGMDLTTERIKTLNFIRNTTIEMNIVDKYSVDHKAEGTLVTIIIPLNIKFNE